MGKTKIDWCDLVQNPVWGCLHDCSWCYARKMARRFGDQIAKINTTNERDYNIMSKRLCSFKPTWIDSNFLKSFPKNPSRIFVNSMSDIAFWKPEWFKKVIIKISRHPQHTFMFLTKAPKIYNKYHFPSNCWLGTTVTSNEDISKGNDMLTMGLKNITFLSIEPILGNAIDCGYVFHNWVIVGLQTGSRQGFVPDLGTVKDIVANCGWRGVPVFMKESMKKIWKGELIQEFPE